MNTENVRIAFSGLLANKMRSMLTMLGILIGVGAVIVLVAVGTGSSAAVQEQLAGLGTNTLTVFSGRFGPPGGGTGTATRSVKLTDKDVEALENDANAPDVSEVAPVLTAQSITATYDGNTHDPNQTLGTTANYLEIRNMQLASGSAFTEDDVEQARKVVVIGQTVVEELFGVGANPVGEQIKLGGAKFRVVGVLEERGSSGFQDEDDVVIAPVTAVQDSLTGRSSGYSQLIVQAASSDVTDAAQAEIYATLASTQKLSAEEASSTISVLNQASLLETSNESNRIFTVLLGAVAAISLLVGGIGVMNIMLVTVTERTREIGIRKAIGAQRGDILGQFLVEAVLVTMLGGALGVVAGLIGSQFEIVGVAPVVAPYSVFLAFGVAVAIGLFFGIYPANRAASLRPIDALRYE